MVAVWGAGPVGQFAALSATLLGAAEVIVIDRFPERLALAVESAGAHPLNYEETPVLGAARADRSASGPKPGCSRPRIPRLGV